MVVKWGVMGTANIAGKIVHTIGRAEGCEVVAVASRSLERADSWCKDQGLASDTVKRYGSYQELLEDAEVQVVYLPLPTSMHKEWVGKIAKAGKHVLVEKPAALDSREVEEMTAECQAAGVQFMDGVMFMHHLRLPTMVKAVSERLGKITRLNSTFHFFGDAEFQKSNIRVLKGMDGLGCIGDLGWYQVRIMLCLLGSGPVSVRGIAHKRSESGVITSCSASLHFKDDVVGLLDCGFDTHFRQDIVVSGESHSLRCTDFVLNRSEEGSDFTITTAGFEGYGIKEVVETVQGEACCQELRMIEKMRDIVQSGKLDDYWPSITWATQRVCDAIESSCNLEGRLIDL